MNQVENVKQICKEKGVAISKLEKECGFSNGYISQLRKGVFPTDRLIKIAKYLNVPLDTLAPQTFEVDYVFTTPEGNEILIEMEPNIAKALSGPDRDRLIAYAKKLNELNDMDK